MTKMKFQDCETCFYFSRRHQNPACGECDSGEFYRERIVIREKNRNELMDYYEDMHNDDAE